MHSLHVSEPTECIPCVGFGPILVHLTAVEDRFPQCGMHMHSMYMSEPHTPYVGLWLTLTPVR